jgi:pimeloyl-ACP methyl ester carboxylesterase
MSVVQNGDVTIHFEVEGTGPPLVLHTGAGGDLRIWRNAGYPAGLKGFRLILMDQRGRGQSSRPNRAEDHAMSEYVDDIRKVLDAVGEESTGFWGYSNGALVGLAFGAAFPRRLRALVGTGALPFLDLTELPPIPDEQTFIAERVASGGVRADVDRFMKEEHDRFPDAIDRNVRQTDPFMGALRGIAWRAWHGPKSILPSISMPVLIIAGEKETADGTTQKAVDTLPNGRLSTVPGVGHLGVFYRSDLALPIALPFLREHLREAR